MRSLMRYLEAKREGFPRFYFVSNEQIIEIVSMLQDCGQLEMYLCKLFEGIDRLLFVYKGDYKKHQADDESDSSERNQQFMTKF